jgi:hypothetical protein
MLTIRARPIKWKTLLIEDLGPQITASVTVSPRSMAHHVVDLELLWRACIQNEICRALGPFLASALEKVGLTPAVRTVAGWLDRWFAGSVLRWTGGAPCRNDKGLRRVPLHPAGVKSRDTGAHFSTGGACRCFARAAAYEPFTLSCWNDGVILASGGHLERRMLRYLGHRRMGRGRAQPLITSIG